MGNRVYGALKTEAWEDQPERINLMTYGECRFFKGHVVAHWHDFHEWLWVEDGSGTVTVSGEEYPYSRGDLLFVHTNRVHGFRSVTGSVLHCIQFRNGLLTHNKPPNATNNRMPKGVLPPIVPAGHAKADEWASLLRTITGECSERVDEPALSHLLCTSAVLRVYAEAMRALGPLEAGGMKVNDLGRIQELQGFVSRRYADDITLGDAARQLHVSVSHLCRLTKAFLGCGFGQYLREYRIGVAQDLLDTTRLSVTEVARLCGYGDPSSFTRAFRDVTGTTPRGYRS